MLTQDKLKELLHYNPETGIFTWLKTMSYRAKSGGIAGYINKGYIFIGIRGKCYAAHRLAWLYTHNEWPKADIDHINHNKSDNSLKNIRSVSKSCNHKNKLLRSDNTSGCCGVSWHKRKNKWHCKIKINGKVTHLGYFSDKFEAFCTRLSANNRYGYHANHGR